jgi:hypothetical protein
LLVLPGALQLRDFFFEGHAGEQVGYALLHGKFRVTVGRGVLGFGCGEGGEGRKQKKDCPCGS